MTTYFKHIAQVGARADYNKIVRTALGKPGLETFHYFDSYPFDAKEGPLVLIGDIAKPLLEAVKKAAPKAVYATGQCTVTEKGDVVFAPSKGKPQLKLLTATLRLAGIKDDIRLAGEDAEDSGETQESETDEVEPPKKPAVKTATPTSPLPKVAPKVELKPVPPKPSNVPAPDPALSKEWQAKVKILRPAFEQALKQAQAKAGSSWAADLDGAFSQMLLEAKRGDFKAALASLARVARMVKSEEAARAEAKQQTMKEDEYYAEATKQSLEELAGKDGAKESRQGAKQAGQGLTEDGHVMYARAVTPAKWKSDVVDSLLGMLQIFKRMEEQTSDQEDEDRLRDWTQKLTLTIGNVQQHALEADGTLDERLRKVNPLMDTLADLSEEIAKLSYPKSMSKEPKQIQAHIEKTRKQVFKARAANGPEPTPEEEKAFHSRDADDERQKERDRTIDKLHGDLRRAEDEWEKLGREGDSGDEAADLKLQQRLEELDGYLKAQAQIIQRVRSETDRGPSEDEIRMFRQRSRDPAGVRALLSTLDVVSQLVQAEQFGQAEEQAVSLLHHLDHERLQEEGDEMDLSQMLNELYADVKTWEQIKGASPKRAQALAKKLKTQAEKFQSQLN